MLPLPGNTAIKLTTARYYTPSGRSIQAKGHHPGHRCETNPARHGMRIREADLDRHLSNDREKEAGKETAKPDAKTANQTPAKAGKDKNGKGRSRRRTAAAP